MQAPPRRPPTRGAGIATTPTRTLLACVRSSDLTQAFCVLLLSAELLFYDICATVSESEPLAAQLFAKSLPCYHVMSFIRYALTPPELGESRASTPNAGQPIWRL